MFLGPAEPLPAPLALYEGFLSIRTNSTYLKIVLFFSCSAMYISRIYFSSTMKNLLEIMIKIALNLEVNMEKIDIFMMSNLTSLSLHCYILL